MMSSAPVLAIMGLLLLWTHKKLATHHEEICESLFHTIVKDDNYHHYKLLPTPHESTYSLKRRQPFNIARFKTAVLRIALLSFHVLKQVTYRLEFLNFVFR